VPRLGVAHGIRLEPVVVRAASVALLAVAVLQAWHYGPYFAGDAVIHLRIIENSAQGAWFQFNLGTPEASSSSVLWTLLGVALVRTGGLAFAVFGLKMVCYLAWLSSGVLVWAIATQLGARRDHAVLGGLTAIALPGTAMNSLMGMENGLFAVLALAALGLQLRSTTTLRLAAVFGLTGLACALRPEGLVLLAVVLAMGLRRPRLELAIAAAALGCTLLPCLAFYASRTGHIVPTSGISRIMAARRSGTSLHVGPLWFYAAPVLRIAVYAPLAAGAWRASRSAKPIAAVIAGGVLLYAFVVGASHTSRYMIWIFALLAVLAAVGARREPRFVPLGLVWLVLVAGGEAYARVVDHAFGVGQGYRIAELVEAPALRERRTTELLADLRAGGCSSSRPSVALHEVQEGFWWDDRVRVLSMDGVTASAGGREAVYDSDGCPRLEDLLADPNVLAVLESPDRLARCVRPGPVQELANGWGHRDVAQWKWTGNEMVRECRAGQTGL
jgi:hypothetical protein